MVTMIINKIINSIIEIVLFSLIPFIWWLITARRKETFFAWIGLKKIHTENRKSALKGILILTIWYILLSIVILYLVKDVDTATSEFKGMGISALPPALIYAIFNTSLPEEILFRGFILKRASEKFGFVFANVFQSVIFGLLHAFMFFNIVGMLKTIIIFAFTASIAYSMGYINENNANGSIFPSWSIHALSNIFASILAMFSLV